MHSPKLNQWPEQIGIIARLRAGVLIAKSALPPKDPSYHEGALIFSAARVLAEQPSKIASPEQGPK